MRKVFPIIPLAAVFLLLAFAAPQNAASTCRAFLEDCGWTMAEDFSEETVTLPEKGDAAWDDYLAMQAENGFPLADYGGRTVLRLRCRVANHPGGENVYANLFWCEGRVVGGDIMSPAMDGFMHGLRKPR